jgi:hypothetical protein
MCLTFAYVQARSAKYEALAMKGCVDIENVMQEHDLQWPDLERVGLVEPKPIQSTAQMLKYQPSAEGRQYLIFHSTYDVLVVKKGKTHALLATARAA